MEDREEWRPAVGFEGICEVSNFGRVKRLAFVGKTGNVYGERILAPTRRQGGYLAVGLRDASGKLKAPRVHALVAAAFLGPRPPGKVVNHKDFDKQNNCISNLEYVTHRENIEHSARHARMGVLTIEQVQALRSLVERDPAIDLDYLAQRVGVSLQLLCGVLDARNYALVPNKDGSMPKPLKYTHRKTICLEDIQDFLALGFSIPQISKYYNVNYSTPYQMLRRAGIWQVESQYHHPGTGRRMSQAVRKAT